MSKSVIDHASAATAASERAIESVQNLLKRSRPMNAHGVYMDRRGVHADLFAAWRDLHTALLAIDGFDWPTPTDYREV